MKYSSRAILLRGEIDPLSGAPDLLGQTIQFQVSDAERAGTVYRTPPQQCLHSHKKLGKSKRLRQVVVGAELEELYLVVDRISRSEYENGTES